MPPSSPEQRSPEPGGRFSWRGPMPSKSPTTTARSPKPALRSASSVSRSPKSPNIRASNMSLASGESVRFRASRASRSSADSEQQRHRASEEAYVGRLSQEHPEPDPFLEAFEYFKEQQRRLDVESSITPEQVEEETRFGCLLSAEEIDQLVEEDAIRRRIQSTILMDIFFGLVIVANGAMMGLTTQGVVDESSDEAQIFELVCMAIFTVEFLLHWLAERCSGSHGCCGSLCRIMKDGWIQFDVLCVIMSWLDFFLTFVFNIGAGTSTFAVLRVVRLMRLLRLVRLLRILQQLWLLLSSMIASMRVLFWAIAMLAAICYIFGILVFTLSQNGSDPLMAAQWGGVLESMFSLAEIATYNGMEIIRKRTEGSDVLLFLPVLFIFMAITSMGIMNLIIGVLLTAVLERGNQVAQVQHFWLTLFHPKVTPRSVPPMAPGSAETPLPRVSTETTEVTETSNGFNRIREALPGPGYFSFHTASSTSTVNLEEPQIVIYGRALDKIKVSKVERKASLRDDKDREPSNTVLFWLCSTIALKGVATQLIFACQKALQENLDFQLSHFAALTTVQMILTNLAGPFWAALADRGTLEKKTILIVGCLGEGISATCFAFVPNFTMMMVVRAFSGFFLAALRPICNGIVADLTSENRRGKVFGRVQGALLCGMFVSDLIAVNMANQSYWLAGANRYLPGWRFLFAAAGVLSMTLALLLRFFLSEPPSVREIRDIRSEVKPASFLTIVGQELCAVIQFLRMPTFLILVFIGIFATIPWSVFGQKIFFFQLCGLKDWQVSILPAANKATAMLGTILGGRMGDCFARLGRFGRPLCAQLALAIAIPVMFLQFYGLPPGEGLFWVYLVLIVIFSIFGFWPQCAANLPILSGIVPAEDSCKVMAWQSAFENCLAHAVGPPMISVLSSAFGYSFGDNPEHSHELNLERARALGKAMAATMCIPWMIAMVAYTCLYWSYPRDMGKLYASLSALLG